MTSSRPAERVWWTFGFSASSRITPRLRQAAAGRLEVLGQHLDVGEHRHEVRVAAPARDDVLVQVGGDRAARDSAEIPADVEAVGRSRTASRAAIPCTVRAWISAASSGSRSPRAGMCRTGATIRWPGRVRKLVEQHDRPLATVDDEARPRRALRLPPGRRRTLRQRRPPARMRGARAPRAASSPASCTTI